MLRRTELMEGTTLFDAGDDPIWVGGPEEECWVCRGFGDEAIDVGYGLLR